MKTIGNRESNDRKCNNNFNRRNAVRGEICFMLGQEAQVKITNYELILGDCEDKKVSMSLI